jgi:hypothetical protein
MLVRLSLAGDDDDDSRALSAKDKSDKKGEEGW